MSITVAADVDITRLTPHVDAFVEQAIGYRRCLGVTEPDPHVATWPRTSLRFGAKPRVARPSVDALLRRAAADTRRGAQRAAQNLIELLPNAQFRTIDAESAAAPTC